MKLINLLSIALLSLLFAGCGSTTYKSEGTVYSNDNSSYRYAFIKNLAGSAGSSSKEEAISIKYDIKVNKESKLNYGGIDNFIIGALLKQGVSVITEEEFTSMERPKPATVLSVEWAVSGREEKAIGFSQEVILLAKDAQTGALIYKGLGEGMGALSEDDIRIALQAALRKFKL